MNRRTRCYCFIAALRRYWKRYFKALKIVLLIKVSVSLCRLLWLLHSLMQIVDGTKIRMSDRDVSGKTPVKQKRRQWFTHTVTR